MTATMEPAGHARTRLCPVLVLGVGNILLRDEGIGVHVAQAMQRMPLPKKVEVVDGATAGLDLLDIIAERRKVVVIDAIDGDFPAGTVIRLTAEDLAPREGVVHSLHGLGLLEVLELSTRLGIAPEETVILGIKPARLDYGLELSPELDELLPRLIELVQGEINEQKGEDRS